MNDSQNMLFYGAIQMLTVLVGLFRKAGAGELATETQAILDRANTKYQHIIDVANQRTGDVG